MSPITWHKPPRFLT